MVQHAGRTPVHGENDDYGQEVSGVKIQIVFQNGVTVDCEVESFKVIRRCGEIIGFRYESSSTATTPLVLKYDDIAGIFLIRDEESAI